VRIDALTINDVLDALVNGTTKGAVHLCNAYTLSLAARDDALASALNDGSLNVADGKPVVWIGRHLGHTQMVRRVYGPELMERTFDQSQGTSIRHYLYGGSPGVAIALRNVIRNRWPNALLVGSESPRFGTLSDEDLELAIERFNESGASIVWVGLGTPKQDFVSARLAARSNLTYIAVGAAFDFIAGTKRQAPAFMREHGLEWLFRFLSEPRRLWKRYLVGNSMFIYYNLRHRPRRALDHEF
jgi:N-acetylglucosaminyldiphosphoundecaprenol N-acetyl-beta-D-mannosaminyltransferase